MKKYIFITFLSFLLNSVSLAEHANEPYEPNGWDKFLVKGSQNYYKFQSELVEDKDVKKEIDNSQKTGLISYLLFEDNKIKIEIIFLIIEIKHISFITSMKSSFKFLLNLTPKVMNSDEQF